MSLNLSDKLQPYIKRELSLNIAVNMYKIAEIKINERKTIIQEKGDSGNRSKA